MVSTPTGQNFECNVNRGYCATGPSPAGGSGARSPHLKSMLPHFTFGPPVATYIQYCILKMCPPFWFLAPPAAKSCRRDCCANAVEHAHPHSLEANDKLIQTRYHVRNTITSRKRQFVMGKGISTIRTQFVGGPLGSWGPRLKTIYPKGKCGPVHRLEFGYIQNQQLINNFTATHRLFAEAKNLSVWTSQLK